MVRLAQLPAFVGFFSITVAANPEAFASSIRTCSNISVQTGVDCHAVGSGSCTGPQDCDAPDVECDPTYDVIQVCGNGQEQATTPVQVHASYNPSTYGHQYRTDTSLSNGYEAQGVVFSLANDTYAGAISFSGLQSGAGYYFSVPQAIPYLVPLYGFWNPDRSDDIYSLNPNANSSLPCNVHGNPSGPPTLDCWYGPRLVGYVGRPCGILKPDEALSPGQAVSSCDDRFHLVMQNDGNLVLYQGIPAQSLQPLWSTNTQGTTGQTAAMQTDGNFVLYDASSTALWSSTTQNNPGSYLAVQTDGNAVVYHLWITWSGVIPIIQRTALWSTQTCCR
jgi:hypothetical protein